MRQAKVDAYVAAVAVAGAAGTAVALPHVPVVALVGLAVAGAAAERFKVTPRPGMAVSYGNVAVLTAITLFGPAAAVAPAIGQALGALPTYPHRGRELARRGLFNAGQWLLSAVAAGGTFAALGGGPAPAVDQWYLLAAAAVVYTVTNVSLVSGIVRVSTGERPTSLVTSTSGLLLTQPFHVAYATLFAVGWTRGGPIGVATVLVLLAAGHQAMRAAQTAWETQESTLRVFVKTIELKDGYTSGHGRRVGDLAAVTAEAMGMSWQQVQDVRIGGLLHDIGKIGVPLAVLRKPGTLTDHEFERIKQHPTIGAELLGDLDQLAGSLPCVLHHHERVDGRGYPHGLAGEEIPKAVRVVTVADAFDAMTSSRAYRAALPPEEAFRRLRGSAGTQFDADVVERFVETVAPMVASGAWTFPEEAQEAWTSEGLDAVPDDACGCCPPQPAMSQQAASEG